MRCNFTKYTKFAFFCLVSLLVNDGTVSRPITPIVVGQGLTDPKVRIYGDRAYLYATHDADPKAQTLPDEMIGGRGPRTTSFIGPTKAR